MARRCFAIVAAICVAAGLPPPSVASAAPAVGLPAAVAQPLTRARIPADALSVVVADVTAAGRVHLAHRADVPMNPASVMKLVTTVAALDVLGPAYTWRTAVYADGPVRDGVLAGSLYLRGDGDPKLVTERLWLLLRRVQALGIRHVAGDIVLDRSAFDLPPHDPGAFDGEPLRPYNAAPDALLVNFRAQVFTFVPDPVAGVARIGMEPPLAEVTVPQTVPLADGPCDDWRAALQADWSDARAPRFRGRYPASCGERVWPAAHPDPARHAARAVAGVWAALGGTLAGQVRDGTVPPGLAPRFVFESPPLIEVVRDVNKFSNNVMAQQLLLTLARAAGGSAPPGAQGPAPQPGGRPPAATFDAARAVVQAWWRERLGPDVPAPVIDNGAGLSREARVTAAALARLLQWVWASPWMPELMASLPAAGIDGTLRRSPMGAGVAHLKTGSLADVQALAGYVHGPRGQRRVLVAIVNHPNARAARPALDALVQWAAQLP
ncbi:D-alanyl-D-alanine carboxypeptidase/D-alanyl-D-alanine-endopeptidase [Tepidimonas taiwanensis]|uniref:D-alanyl-D-alanine carboxypeptidase n=1 Tax=Tepidimonas taiwanensis TaxID=307486 RepID=A0A554X413_9BURK|nr:D-alanyl-D-alanine carboxypeptidase/D-alanyl-D-alanine-endopeptidase [Tepidimonas taiwanensis]MCX7693325.1 D-alanyl-D-alanine carboxypeptidase/D-alanyl-D-alanine-endopeptidase [Tepidimonas taiwanensis]TSE30590.1 D-alanyl-D-alanine carboxypeptidase [Tepidimonas taiwanensis]UBQ05166.1 D-alanyl-D-alanine carboxypeptidase/D-alanyl-D-alanine-endopeptidase [Tepidimonas taiwanensis]